MNRREQRLLCEYLEEAALHLKEVASEPPNWLYAELRLFRHFATPLVRESLALFLPEEADGWERGIACIRSTRWRMPRSEKLDSPEIEIGLFAVGLHELGLVDDAVRVLDVARRWTRDPGIPPRPTVGRASQEDKPDDAIPAARGRYVRYGVSRGVPADLHWQARGMLPEFDTAWQACWDALIDLCIPHRETANFEEDYRSLNPEQFRRALVGS